jgi:uncharacterized membrane protein YphA (DoxX/SURF4 family)
MNKILWILQVVLAAMFLAHGWFMLAPPAEMVEMINAQLGEELRIFIGVAEVLAAAGLILPGVTRIMPWLTAWAAAGLMIVMASATVLHLYRGEVGSAVTTVAYMRWKVIPVSSARNLAEAVD